MAFWRSVGQLALFAASTLSHLVRPPFYPREIAMALLQIGWNSLPVVGLTALFYRRRPGLADLCRRRPAFSAEAVVPQIVAIGIVRELGPVLDRADGGGARLGGHRRRDRRR